MAVQPAAARRRHGGDEIVACEVAAARAALTRLCPAALVAYGCKRASPFVAWIAVGMTLVVYGATRTSPLDPEGYWTGFSARIRAIAYNTNLIVSIIRTKEKRR
jgi:hypothetical protein